MKIHTLDNRDFLLLKVFESADISGTNEDVKCFYNALIEQIGEDSYSDLKSSLIPITDATKKRDKLLIFDIEKIDSLWYGRKVFSNFIEFLSTFEEQNEERYSILAGDLISEKSDINDKINKIIIEELGFEKFDLHQKDYYLYYVHNISKEQSERLEKIFRKTDFFIGMIDITFHSFLKDYIVHFSPLVNILVRSKNKIYLPEDSPYTQFIDDKGSLCVQEIEFNIFALLLSFKIETNYETDDDRRLAVESINGTDYPHNVEDVNLFVHPDKVDKYLLSNKHKSAIMRSLGLGEINSYDLSKLILDKLKSCYFYNLEFMEGKDFKVSKFSVVIELPYDRPEEHMDKLRKVQVGLKYEDGKLKLLTMY